MIVVDKNTINLFDIVRCRILPTSADFRAIVLEKFPISAKILIISSEKDDYLVGRILKEGYFNLVKADDENDILRQRANLVQKLLQFRYDTLTSKHNLVIYLILQDILKKAIKNLDIKFIFKYKFLYKKEIYKCPYF